MHTFTGTAYERGEQHGREFAQAIGKRAGRSLPADLDSAQRTRIAQPWLDAAEEIDVDLVREMAGIAAGSGITLAEVLLLNCFEAFKVLESEERGGCTVVGATTKDQTVVAQNWDANPQRALGLAVHRHRGPDTPDVVVLSSPGGLGWIGMNEYGLALVNNDLLGGPISRAAAPSQVIRRVLLKQTDTSSAVSVARAVKHPALRSYVLADSSGVLAAMEVLPHDAPVVHPATPDIVHANHGVASKTRAIEDRGLQEFVFPSSEYRERRAKELMERSHEESDQQARLHRVLSDHERLPLSICRHADPSELTLTVASVVFDCTQRQATFRLGLACEPTDTEVVDFGVTASFNAPDDWGSEN